jgi:hypothetical protein
MLGILKWLTGLRRGRNGRPWYLPPPLSEREVSRFERAQGIRLPEDYREYLLNVAGAPPGYARGYSLHDCLEEHAKYGDFLRAPFPHSESWNDWESDDYDDDKHVMGSLLLTHEGCTRYFRLVVTGPMRGTVWEDDRGATSGISPLTNAAGEPKTFKEWTAQFGWIAKAQFFAALPMVALCLARGAGLP